MSATIYFGTIHEPQAVHKIAFDAYSVGKGMRHSTPNITQVIAEYYGEDGCLLLEQPLDHQAVLTSLPNPFHTRCLIMLRVQYQTALPINIYGFLLSPSCDEGVTYPVNAAVGYPEISTWMNRQVVPLSPPSPGWHHELFVANPSRWAGMRYKLRFYVGERTHTVSGYLAPKAHSLISLEAKAAELGFGNTCDAVALISRNKAVAYLVGRHTDTGKVSFVEHFISQPRVHFRIPPPPLPATTAEDRDKSPLDAVLCYCNGMTLSDALGAKGDPTTGNYCTGCRDDLRRARQILTEHPNLVGEPAELRRMLETREVR